MKQGQGRIATAPEAPRKDKTIRVVEYVHTAEGVKPVEELGPEEREKFRRWLLCTWLNVLFAGKAVAYYRDGGTDSSTPLGMTGDGRTDSSAPLGMTGDGGAGYG
jgi:hypothetical protein